MQNWIQKTTIAIAAGALFISSGSASANQADAPKPTSAAADAGDGLLRYQVRELQGNVKYAKSGVDPAKDAEWQSVRVGDLLGAGIQIRVPLRGKIKFVSVPATPATVIQLERQTLVEISELDFRNNEANQPAAHSRMKLGYGAIRAGVAEGDVRSDMEISCPVATLSKKGTDIFRFEYHDGTWSMSLSELGRGRIQAIQNLYTGIVGSTSLKRIGGMQTRDVLPGQSVTEHMLHTIDTELFSRFVNVNELFGLPDSDIKLIALLGDGMGIRGLDGDLLKIRTTTGHEVVGTPNGAPASPLFGGGANLQLQQAINMFAGRQQQGTHVNPAGDFGVGQGTIPSIFGTQSNPSSNARARITQGMRQVIPNIAAAQAKMNLMRNSSAGMGKTR